MISHTTAKFRAAFQKLPPEVQQRARKVYALWSQNPAHASLQFKQVHARRPIFSVRIGLGWRALAVREGEHVIWFWIGSHADYDKLLAQL